MNTQHKQNRKASILCTALIMAGLLTGCAHQGQSINGMHAGDFTRASVSQSAMSQDNVDAHMQSQQFVLPDDPNSAAVLTSSGFGNNTQLLHAYQKYLANGHAENVKGQGITTLAYSPYKRPLLVCAPLNLCQIILQKGEDVSDVVTGDPTRWQISQLYMGDKEKGTGSVVIVLKPSSLKIATDLTITTNKRIYRFALLAKAGADSPTVNFWYPKATLHQAIVQSQHHFKAVAHDQSKVISTDRISLKDANFNYSTTGDHPAWMPTQVFDNGHKTFVRFPSVVGSMNLPVFFVDINGAQSLANYRYKQPYLIFDGVFKQAMLVSGKGKHKVQVNLINNSYPK